MAQVISLSEVSRETKIAILSERIAKFAAHFEKAPKIKVKGKK